ncbi:MAG: Rrf2 family transcriptional regulator [Acidimicrobiia bacterium]
MRLEVTRRSDLAAKALLELARTGERMKSPELANCVGTTPGFLAQAMSPLVAEGWVRSIPGPNGGYVAVADPNVLSVLDIIEAVEGHTETGRCVLEDRHCAASRDCALHEPWSLARSHLRNELAATSLAMLLNDHPVSKEKV